MRFSKKVLFVLMALSPVAAQAESTAVVNKKVEVSQITGLNCRAGSNYWESSKGFTVSLSTKKLTYYKDNGRTQGESVQVQCAANVNAIVCQGEDLALTIYDVQQQEYQTSEDSGDFLGSLVGVQAKRASVTPGILVKAGFFGDSEKPVVCVVR